MKLTTKGKLKKFVKDLTKQQSNYQYCKITTNTEIIVKWSFFTNSWYVLNKQYQSGYKVFHSKKNLLSFLIKEYQYL